MSTIRRPSGRIATRNGRPAYEGDCRRLRQPVTNADWFNRRREQQSPDIFEGLFGKLLAKVRQ
jgi:hypothetical protein